MIEEQLRQHRQLSQQDIEGLQEFNKLQTRRLELLQLKLHEEYYKERCWCKKKGVDLKKWDIEIKYKQQGHKIHFFTRVNELRRAQRDK